jgi:hypothetical protein
MKEPRSFISRAQVRNAANAKRDIAPPTLMRLTLAAENCSQKIGRLCHKPAETCATTKRKD